MTIYRDKNGNMWQGDNIKDKGNFVSSSSELSEEAIEASLPALSEQMSGLKEAMVLWKRDGLKLTTREERKRRWEICLSCPALTPKGRCTKCGCYMRLKTKLAGQICPLDKW